MDAKNGIESRMNEIYAVTPLIKSDHLSRMSGYNVFLKCENLQPSGSFKLRGHSHLIKKSLEAGCDSIVSSSGGNAGMAAAYTANKLGIEATVVIPDSTPKLFVNQLQENGAKVVVCGHVWSEANEKAIELSKSPTTLFVHPFDHKWIWEGCSTLVDELKTQLPQECIPPDLIVLSVGGGGLLCGVVTGLQRVGWNDVPVLAMETEEANCFQQAISRGESFVTETPTSIAKSLGANYAAKKAVELSKVHPIFSETVSDAQAVGCSDQFANDHRMLVEPACGATLSAIYEGVISDMIDKGKLTASIKNVVLVVCGGAGVTLELLSTWQGHFRGQNALN